MISIQISANRLEYVLWCVISMCCFSGSFRRTSIRTDAARAPKGVSFSVNRSVGVRGDYLRNRFQKCRISRQTTRCQRVTAPDSISEAFIEEPCGISNNGSGFDGNGASGGNGGGNGSGNAGFTVDDAIERIGFGKYQNLLMFYLGLGWAADAMEVLLLSFLSPAVKCEWGLTGSQESWITSVVFIGMAFGAYTWGAVSDKFGRKPGFLATAVVTGVLGIASAFAPDYQSLLISRGLVGFGLAGAPMMYTMFSEFVPKDRRGVNLLLFQIFWSFGAIFEAGLAWYTMPRFGWRGLVLGSSLPFVLLCCLYPFVPESPRFLALNGKLKEARQTLEQVAEVNGTSLPAGPLVGPPIAVPDQKDDPGFVQQAVSQAQSLLSGPLWRTSVSVWTCWIGASLGYYGIVMLTTEIHTQTGGATCMDNMITFNASDFSEVMIDTVAELPAFLFALLTVETAGRKWSVTAGFFAAALSVASLLVFDQNPTVSLFFTRLCVSFAFAMVFVYTPEAYPTSIRSFAVGIASVFSRAGGFSAPFVSQELLHKSGLQSVAGLYMLVFLSCGVFANLLPKDTTGEALAETIADIEVECEERVMVKK